MSKKYDHLIRSVRRQRRTRESFRKILVVCEDAKSAPNYFQALRIGGLSIRGSGTKTDPCSVVEIAVRAKAVSKDDGDPFDEVWVCIDGDCTEHLPKAQSLARKNGIRMCISTPCFEYWVLLHYEDFFDSLLRCSDAIDRLIPHVGNYDKGKFCYDDVVKLVDQAIARSQKTENLKNPSTDLHLLLESLNSSVAAFKA